jgi:hypothetical protein
VEQIERVEQVGSHSKRFLRRALLTRDEVGSFLTLLKRFLSDSVRSMGLAFDWHS